MLGQLDLGSWIAAALGESDMWSIQRRIAGAASKRRARVAVPSCNASGKTWLAARLALAFYDAYTPGTPCAECDPSGDRGGCRGSKVLTTSSQFDHLRDNLWGEMRLALAELAGRGIFLAGKMSIGQNLRLESSAGSHFIVGRSPNKAEGFQGFHAAHKLILGDEATSLDEQMQQGITGLLATGDSRLVLIFNPTTDDTYAAMETRSPRTEVIKITAFDTPHFTGEKLPPGSNLTTPEWLEELKDKGMGPGTFEWSTRVLAEFWTMGDDVLIPGDLYDQALGTAHVEGTRALGVDLAPYGSDENVIAYRDGNALSKLQAFPAMRTDLFFESAVADAVQRFDPHYLIWDADGVGAGAYGYAEKIMANHNREGGTLVLLPFRGGVHVTTKFTNTRSAWWWALRRRFQNGSIALTLPPDDKLRAQVIDIRYTITDTGDIKVEPKKEMKKRGTESPDRGDACLVPGTLVTTARGPVPIEAVRRGDRVLTRAGWRPVLAAGLTLPVAQVLTVTLEDGRRLTGTAEHPVWVVGRGFTPLGSLTPCDTLLLCDDTALCRVAHVTYPGASSPVYNLTVADQPEFFANGVLVHNCMYAFSMVEELPIPARVIETPIQDRFNLSDRSEKAMWERDLKRLRTKGGNIRRMPWDRLPAGQDAWDDWS